MDADQNAENVPAEEPAQQQPQQPAQQQPQQQPQQVQQIVYSDASAIKPPSFSWDSDDLPKQFKGFRRYCELMMNTPTYRNRPGEEIVSYILLWMGPRAVEIFDNWTHLTAVQKDTPSAVWDAFQTYFEPKSNFRLARFQLRDLQQQQNEPVDSFLTRLRAQASKCNFSTPDSVDDNILDQLIKGVSHGQVRKKLLDYAPSKLTLDKAMDFARTYEATETQLQQFKTEGNIHSVRKTKPQQPQQHSKAKHPPKKQSSNQCTYCGRQRHKSMDDCPAKGQKCNKCGRIGHWGKVCLNPQNPVQSQNKRNGRKVHSVKNEEQETDQLSSTFENMTFSVINVSIDSNNRDSNSTEALATIQIEPYKSVWTNLRGKVDTGAEGNILPLRVFKQIFPRYISPEGVPLKTTPSSSNLTDYNGGRIVQYGTIRLPCKYKGKQHSEEFYVADAPGPVIYGLQTSERLGMVQMNCSI